MNIRKENVKKFTEELRKEWKTMWRSKIDDKIKAESIADKTYEGLFMDRGTIIFASKDCNPPNFKEILKKHLSSYWVERYNPHPAMGGIHKFIRQTKMQNSKTTKRKKETCLALKKMKNGGQLKKKGKGWLNLSM
jgi:hypothetical protein